MANVTRTLNQATNVVTYVITDTVSNTATLVVSPTNAAAKGDYSTALSGGPLRQDGMQALAQLALAIGAGQVP